MPQHEDYLYNITCSTDTEVGQTMKKLNPVEIIKLLR